MLERGRRIASTRAELARSKTARQRCRPTALRSQPRVPTLRVYNQPQGTGSFTAKMDIDELELPLLEGLVLGRALGEGDGVIDKHAPPGTAEHAFFSGVTSGLICLNAGRACRVPLGPYGARVHSIYTARLTRWSGGGAGASARHMAACNLPPRRPPPLSMRSARGGAGRRPGRCQAALCRPRPHPAGGCARRVPARREWLARPVCAAHPRVAGCGLDPPRRCRALASPPCGI